MNMPDPLAITALLGVYLDADYRWELGGDWHWIRVGSTAPEIDAAFPQASRYALLSAWNPHSIVCAEALNSHQDQCLQADITAGGHAHRAAFSSAPDRTWREPSWLVIDMAASRLDALARRFGQLGTLAWERGQPVRLRMDVADPAGGNGRSCVDWLK